MLIRTNAVSGGDTRFCGSFRRFAVIYKMPIKVGEQDLWHYARTTLDSTLEQTHGHTRLDTLGPCWSSTPTGVA